METTQERRSEAGIAVWREEGIDLHQGVNRGGIVAAKIQINIKYWHMIFDPLYNIQLGDITILAISLVICLLQK